MKNLGSVGLAIVMGLCGCKQAAEKEAAPVTIPLPSTSATTEAAAAPVVTAPPPVDTVASIPAATATTTNATIPAVTTVPKPKPNPVPSATTSASASATPPAFSIASCCAALHRSANSASPLEQPVYSMAASSCDTMPPEPASLSVLRGMTSGVGTPSACS